MIIAHWYPSEFWVGILLVGGPYDGKCYSGKIPTSLFLMVGEVFYQDPRGSYGPGFYPYKVCSDENYARDCLFGDRCCYLSPEKLEEQQ